MDPIGTTASLITLIDLAVKTFKVVNRIVQSYRNALAELIDLKHQVDGLNSQLLLLRQVQQAVSTDPLLLNNTKVNQLEHFFLTTISLFSEIHDFFEKQSLRTSKGGRIKWALHYASKVKAWKLNLRHHSSGLGTILLLLNVYVCQKHGVVETYQEIATTQVFCNLTSRI